MTENQLQIQCVRYLRENYPDLLHHHSPNEYAHTQGQRYHGKNMGMLSGFPDLWILSPSGETVFIEFKTEKGTLSPVQKEIHAIFSRYYQNIFVVRNLDQFQEVIRNNFETLKSLPNEYPQ